MKKSWLIAAALVAGAACSETTRKDVDRNTNNEASPARASSSPRSRLSSEAPDDIDDNTYVTECETQKAGMAP